MVHLVALPALTVDEDLPNGEGSILRYFRGDEDDDDGDTGMHLRLFGDAGLISGSKSILLFRVAPHAMASVCQWRCKKKKKEREKQDNKQPTNQLLHITNSNYSLTWVQIIM